ncbi:heterokaryon incompatibility protein-domain-containing protein [Podospora didyma]|uniref:Heterokaryon incompatibility protein-domain-containing protein n=1 Tax=Podospora didyma TaxID=330526 RepID=A0AAE0NGW6_9PEZI|nr:heterokaryon incompatibility protein-domain-containing protein [Podospora didyma]
MESSESILEIAVTSESLLASQIRKRVVLHPFAEPSIHLIKSWLRDCTEGHAECPGDVEETELPTRVIDLGTHHEHNEPKLLIPKGMTGAYIALSHCWGSKPALMTTHSNIEELQQGICTSNLPRTFLDAFAVARKLGIRYLWIDCLCITQDDRADWETQARMRSSVYERAFLTIASTRSGSGEIPFLRDDAPMFIPDAETFFRGTFNDQQGNFYLKNTAKEPHADAAHFISEAPLNKRGWVLQERLLSRRILHFADDQVYWECRRHALGLEGSVFRADSSQGFLFPLPSLIQKLHISHNTPDDLFLKTWLHIVEFYSACQFTFEQDRPTALLGLVDRLGRLTRRRYFEAQWFMPSSSELPISMLWTACGSGARHKPEQPMSPSWSWLSAAGEFSFASVATKSTPMLLNRISFSTSATPLTMQSLHIKCKTFQAYTDQSSDKSGTRVRQIKRNCSPGGFVRAAPPQRNHDNLANLKLNEYNNSFIGHIKFDSKDGIPEEIYCMHLFADLAGYTRVMAVEKLSVSSEAGGHDLPQYRRVGIGSLARGRDGLNWFEEMSIALV